MESNHLLRAYQTPAQPKSFAGMEVSARIELASPRYKCGASPAMLADRNLGAKAANRTRVASLPKMHSATELPRLEPRRRIELRSERYECSALPLSYRGNGASDRTRTGVYCMARSNPSHWTTPARKLERNVRIELTSGVWKTPALPLDESRLVAGVGIEPTRAEDYETSLAPCVPASQHSIVKELVGDLGLEPRVSCSQSKRVKPFPKSPKMKKAGILSDPASEK